MTVYVSLRKEFYQLLKPLIPDSVKILYRAGFSLAEYNKTDADFIITEINLLDDYENYSRYPHSRMVLLGSENRELDKIAPLLEKSAKYFSCRKMDEVLRYLFQKYHYEKTAVDALICSDGFKRIIGISKMICQVKHEIEQYAPFEETVTILGESGTGKELVARALHEHSSQSGPFVAKNCCAIPDLLLESELFGAVKGAYTGSIDKIGLFEQAHNGTLFLDEIGDISLNMQSKLLRAVETKTINPLGSTEFRKVNTRIITATSRDLKAMIQERSFRMDLYYRINTLMIQLKPLRERKEDIPQLCCSILANYKIPKRLSTRALNKLLDYSWPGNIRELRSTLIRAIIHASYEKEITEKDILLY